MLRCSESTSMSPPAQLLTAKPQDFFATQNQQLKCSMVCRIFHGILESFPRLNERKSLRARVLRMATEWGQPNHKSVTIRLSLFGCQQVSVRSRGTSGPAPQPPSAAPMSHRQGRWIIGSSRHRSHFVNQLSRPASTDVGRDRCCPLSHCKSATICRTLLG